MKTETLLTILLAVVFIHGLLTSTVTGIAGSRNPKSANGNSAGNKEKVYPTEAYPKVSKLIHRRLRRYHNNARHNNTVYPTEDSYAKVSKVINKRLKRYDKNVRPNDTGSPVEVLIEFKVVAFGNIREEDMDYTIDIFFRQWWKDPRLAHGVDKVFNGAIDPTKLGAGLWTPDTYFRNVKSSNYHSISRENMRLRISKDGSIYFSARITLTAQCDMDLSLFPLDTQSCDLIIESYAYTVADVTYNWRNRDGKSVEVFATGMAQFDLISIVTSKKASTNSKGSFDSLKATFTLKRRSTYFIFQHFIPSAFVVFLSWLSFWIDRHAVPARVSLVITCILTSMVLFKSINSSLPRISYLKAVDYFLITSFLFIVSSMVEFVYVLNFPDSKKELPRCHSFAPPPTPNQTRSSIADIMDQPGYGKDRPSVTGSLTLRKGFFLHESLNSPRRRAHYEGYMEGVPSKQSAPHFIDRYARKVFPLLYGLFNIVYWSYYLPRS